MLYWKCCYFEVCICSIGYAEVYFLLNAKATSIEFYKLCYIEKFVFCFNEVLLSWYVIHFTNLQVNFVCFCLALSKKISESVFVIEKLFNSVLFLPYWATVATNSLLLNVLLEDSIIKTRYKPISRKWNMHHLC